MVRSIALAFFAAAAASAQGVDYLKANYTKYEYRIPMRDGKKLFTAVYVPKDASKSYPFLMIRTPYSVAPYGVDRYPPSMGPSEKMVRDGYIFVAQDVRGRYQSEGTFLEMTPAGNAINEGTDTYDTVDWLVKNVPGNNGKLGTWGISYPGFYAAAGMLGAHPAHVAASPQAPMIDLFHGDDAYHNGAFMLAANFGFYTSFKPHREPTLPARSEPFEYNTPDAYEWYLTRLGVLKNSNEIHLRNSNPYWASMVEHPAFDAFWKERSLEPHLKAIRPAVLLVGGWFDAEDLQGPLRALRAIERQSPQTQVTLVEGPWVHGGWARGDGASLGNVSFNAKTGDWYRDNVVEPFFQFHLKGKGDWKAAKAIAFETGTNVWRRYDTWPPKESTPRTLYFQSAGKLSWQAPAADGDDKYTSDPAHPVPFIEGTAPGVPREYMTGDQRFAARRPDVLTYQTEPLEEDVTIAGPVEPSLFVATTATDSDFVVKLIDVYPGDYPQPESPSAVRMGGYQQLVRGEPFRGKYRKSFEKAEAFTPGRVEQIRFSMPDVHHTFRRGHRIMVQVQSTWFPLVDRNPQKFMEIPAARAEDFAPATQTVKRGKGTASGVTVHVMGAAPTGRSASSY